jgi:O-antigen ligase
MIFSFLSKYFKDFLPIFLFLLYFLTGFNNYNGAIDKIGFQWLYLSVFNIIAIIFFYYKKEILINLKAVLSSSIIISFSLFFLWSVLSLLYAFNTTESLLLISRWLICLITVINLSLLLLSIKIDHKLISVLISIIFICELYFSLSTFLQIIFITDFDFSYSNLLKGVTGNKNITSSILALKLPFLLYFFHFNKNKILQVILFVSYFLGLITMYALSSRAIFISLSLISLILLILTIFYKYKDFILYSSLRKITSFHFVALIFSLLFFQSFQSKDSNVSLLSRVTSINTTDTSTTQRLRYYDHALDFVLNNPLIGVGVGNWKIKSIDYDKNFINGYTVPYHVHNDFLEITTELGVIGLILYLAIFISVLFSLFKNFKNRSTNTKIFIYMVFLSGIIYFIDANLNFPYARVINQIMFLSLLALSIVNQIKFKTK